MSPAGGIVIGAARALRPTVEESTFLGRAGHIRWQSLRACDVQAFAVTRGTLQDARRWSVFGYVSSVNALLLRQRPLTFEMPHKLGAWWWPVVALDVRADGTCRADLGPPIVPETVAAVAQLQRLAQLQRYEPMTAPVQLQRLLQQRLAR